MKYYKAIIIIVIFGGIIGMAFWNLYVNNSKAKIDKIIINLINNEDSIRFQAIDLLKKIRISKELGIKLLKASKGKYPSAQYEWQSIPAILIDTAVKYPDKEYINVISEVFKELDSKAKESALRFLQDFDSTDSIKAYVNLAVDSYLELSFLPTTSLERNPKYQDIMFPALFEVINNKMIAYDVYSLALRYTQKGLIDLNQYNFLTSEIINECKYNSLFLTSINKSEGTKWIWDDEKYLEARYKQGIILDLLGYIQNSEAVTELYSAMNINDNKLKLFTITSLLRKSVSVDEMEIQKVAADSETRNWLYDQLKIMNKTSLYPKKYLSQEAFAESNMVNWLIYPTELGRIPDEIELIKVFEEDSRTKDGILEFYLFRFRSNNEDWKDNGWMVGISGPFMKRDKPSTMAYGYTFSSFEKWEDKTVEDHLSSVREIIDNWKTQQKY